MAFCLLNPIKFQVYKEKCNREYHKDFDPDKYSKVALRLGFDIFTEERKQAFLYVLKRGYKIYNPDDPQDNTSKYRGTIELTWNWIDQDAIRNGVEWKKKSNGKPYPVKHEINNEKAFKNHCIPKPKILDLFKIKKYPYNYEDIIIEFFTESHNLNTVDICKYASLFHNKTIGLSEYERMDVLAFDIDCHDGDEIHTDRTLYYLLKELNFPEIMYAEKSVQGGYHIFIHIDDVVPDDFKLRFTRSFENKYKSEEYKIEMRMRNKIFRLPDSPSYMPCKLNIKDVEYIEAIPYKNRTEWYDHVLSFNNPLPVKVLEDFNNNYYKEEYLLNDSQVVYPPEIECDYLKLPEEQPNLTTIKPLSEKALDVLNVKTTPKIDGLKRKLFHDYPIHAGNRVNTMKSIASLCYFLKLDEEQFFLACMSNNVDSKDFTRWSQDEARMECYQFYNNMTKHFDISYSPVSYDQDEKDTFHSNVVLLTDEIISWCNRYTDFVFKEMIEPTMKSGKWINETKRALEILAKEIIGFMIYDFYLTKKYNPQSGITHEKFLQLKRGVQPKRKMLDLMKDHYEIKIDIHKLFNIFMTSGIFVQIKSSERGWSHGPRNSYSRQWRLAESLGDWNFIWGKSIQESIIINIKRVIEK